MAQAERDASDPMTPFGYQEDGSYVPCPDCFTLPDGGCAAGGHGDAVALTASPVSIEVYEHPSGQIQVMIGDDSGGFRLAGPQEAGRRRARARTRALSALAKRHPEEYQQLLKEAIANDAD